MDMETLNVALGERSYPIHVGPGLLAQAGALLTPLLSQPRVVILTNPVVGALWLAPLRASLAAAGIASESIMVPDGEAFKSWPTLQDVLTRLLEQKVERASTLVALGGGVVGDLAGFAAAIYQRGIPFRADADDAARASRFVGRRQDRHQPRARQEHDRRVSSAARRADRHRLASRRCPIASFARASRR
jgi:alcohol dehydrogenase class IV